MRKTRFGIRRAYRLRFRIGLALVFVAVATRGAARRISERPAHLFWAHNASLASGAHAGRDGRDGRDNRIVILPAPGLGAFELSGTALLVGPDGDPLGVVDDPLSRAQPTAPLLSPFDELVVSRTNEGGDSSFPFQMFALQVGSDEVTACPADMVLVDGNYCPVVAQVCLRELAGPVERCAEFARSSACAGRVQHKRFCIDRYEYPNRPGIKPMVMVTWKQAKAICEDEGRRLCTDSEWTLACEGEQRRPYPYGFVRDASACNIDRRLPSVDQAAFADPRRAAIEATRLDQRVASGDLPSCTSPFGVHDMTGNVDEWVVNERHFAVPAGQPGRPFVSGLKGGYWGPVRDRCRPMTTAHDETFRYYQIGFRCCAAAD